MRIAIDARELLSRPTGVGRYLAELLARWTRNVSASDRELLLVSPAPLDVSASWRGSGGARVTDVVAPGTGGTWWEQTTLARALARLRPDALFAPAYTAPLLGGWPLVLALHDVSFAAHPEWFGWREGLRRRVLARAAARKSRVVLTLSTFSRDEIARRLHVPDHKIRVIPPAVDSHPCFGDPGRKLPLGPPGREPLVLYVGSIFNRRHVPDLLAAFADVAARRPDLRLTLIGANRTHPHQDLQALAARHGVSGRVDLWEWVDDATLRDVYARARVFVFLSEYEGFGLTPLEALRAGVPIIVLDTPAGRETYGEAAVYVAPRDVPAVSAALVRLLDDENERARRLVAGARVLSALSWDRTAIDTLAALDEAAR